MTTPSPKEALEAVLAAAQSTSPEMTAAYEMAKAALATLSPQAGERRDSRAAFEKVWANRPWLTYEETDKDRAFRWWSEGAIFASGLVQDEAGWRTMDSAPKDMTEIIVLCGPKDVRLGWYFAPSSTTFGWRDQHQKPINPTHWMPLPAPPIRSARAGGAS